ncbi:AraC family transcriptional regulator [Nitrospirillum sp. BR 11164]|uniref:AraC family transcriptional regulator n=1 Tax=Nitrospirillum sp. BR 11164 TaxID=3104324 RepID=UPI002AFE8BFE|nr:AraC family transcriptional regulator [Nitrospirillum sp. BR 11164]MEA1648564.1 AraC family transcriptional regulator [Nitrospirillum sp. BR 11164]
MSPADICDGGQPWTTPGQVDVFNLAPVCMGAPGGQYINRALRTAPGHGMTTANAPADAYLLVIQLGHYSSGAVDTWCDGRHFLSPPQGPGSFFISDLHHVWEADIREPFHTLSMRVSRAALDAFADENDMAVGALRCPVSHQQCDMTFRGLALALLPALTNPAEGGPLFLDYTFRTALAYVVSRYGVSPTSRPRRAPCGLAPWQQRRVATYVDENLGEPILLTDLARECSLSPSYFGKAFKSTHGCPPHKWVLKRRIERATELLLGSKLPLADIALAVGFTDQSHFTRVFSRHMRTPPAAWRRARMT